ncbi:solute carrier family 23 protein, partial [Klebsiella michiganensis]
MDTLLVGSEVPRVDGLAKVTGKAVYGDDIIMKNMLYGVCRYVDIPAGRIEALDLSEAEKVPGVVRIATWNDIPGQRKLGAIVPDHPPIIDKEIAYRGDVVAVVAAETYEAACIAVDKIKITYTPWEPITSPEEAMKPGARLIHSELDSNIINRHHTAKGDIDAGFAASTHIFEREYEVGFQEHGYIEPESITAYLDNNEQIMTIEGSIQNAHRTRAVIAKYLDLPQAKVNIKRSVLGGAGIVMFGMVAVSGIRTLGQVNYRNNNNGMVVALTLGLGMMPVLVPNLFTQFPPMVQLFLHSGITIGTLTAIVANLTLNGSVPFRVNHETPVPDPAPPSSAARNMAVR